MFLKSEKGTFFFRVAFCNWDAGKGREIKGQSLDENELFGQNILLFISFSFSYKMR